MIGRRTDRIGAVSFDLPSSPGTYVLVLRTFWESVIEVGSLGELSFPAGRYLYVGSALGPGGLKARIGHHCRFSDPPRWHIDYLRLAASPEEVWYQPSDSRMEHSWAGLLAGTAGVETAADGFGSGDCRCRSHLYRCDDQGLFDRFGSLAGGKVRRSLAVRAGR